MNQRSVFRKLRALILMASLVVAASATRVLAGQENPMASEGTQPKASTGGNKADATPKTTPLIPAQSPEPDQTPAWGPYEVFSSIEFGIRGIGIQGNGNKFRSDHNYDPGFRVFDASLMLRSNGTGGALFDELMINTFGWSNDPNRYLRVDATKTDLYKFTANYRRIDYFNSLTNFAAPPGIPNSQHTADTQYRQGDFDLSLWPAYQKFRLNLGYSLDFISGPSVSTSRYSSDEFPVLAPVRVHAHDYRVGFDSRLGVFDLSFLQGWRFFKEDTTYFIDERQTGNDSSPSSNPSNSSRNTVIDTYQRDVPTRGKIPYTRFSVHTLLAQRVDITGRIVYVNGTTDYAYFDFLTGTNSSNRRVTSDVIRIVGDAKRPNVLGDLSATVLVTPWLRISDSFRAQAFRIIGGNIYNQVATVPTAPTPVTTTNRLEFSTTHYRRYVNTIETDFDLNKRLSFHLGFRYTDRRIEEEFWQVNLGATPPESEPVEFDNRTGTFIFGFKAKPVRMWSLYFDIEHGDNDNVFTRTANYDYTNIRARSIVRPTPKLSFNASVITRDNTNPTVTAGRDFSADINARIFSGSGDWTASERLNLSGGYTYFHVTGETLVQFNSAGGVVNIGPARYFMRDRFAFATAYWQPHNRVSLYGAYRIHHDRGQGDRLTTPLVFINSYPYQLSSPEAKVSVRLHRNVDWIAGYQYFDYKEQFANNQFYQAHLPYTSLRIHLGRSE